MMVMKEEHTDNASFTQGTYYLLSQSVYHTLMDSDSKKVH